MDEGRYRFGPFMLDAANRRLSHDGDPLELSGRYLDALVLLVEARGDLVTKDRFHNEVWRGVPVTDEALTQCIRTLRKALDDNAGNPRFIETVPKHGYRFIAEVTGAQAISAPAQAVPQPWRETLTLGTAGAVGGSVAGLIGGIGYGFDATSQPLEPGMGAASVVLVLIVVTTLVATIGAAGVAVGIGAARAVFRDAPALVIAGGALGGLITGALAKLLGVDAFGLLVGQSPGNITGGAEGILLGGAVGLAAWIAIWGKKAHEWRRAVTLAALIGGIAGLAIPLLGGRMMGGSLDLLARQFPGSRLRFEQLGRLFGESDFGIVSQAVTGALEGALFAACIVGSMLWVRHRFSGADARSLRQQ